MAKSLRKSSKNHKARIPKSSILLAAKHRYYFITTFEMLKMGFKFEYKRLTKKV